MSRVTRSFLFAWMVASVGAAHAVPTINPVLKPDSTPLANPGALHGNPSGTIFSLSGWRYWLPTAGATNVVTGPFHAQPTGPNQGDPATSSQSGDTWVAADGTTFFTDGADPNYLNNPTSGTIQKQLNMPALWDRTTTNWSALGNGQFGAATTADRYWYGTSNAGATFYAGSYSGTHLTGNGYGPIGSIYVSTAATKFGQPHGFVYTYNSADPTNPANWAFLDSTGVAYNQTKGTGVSDDGSVAVGWQQPSAVFVIWHKVAGVYVPTSTGNPAGFNNSTVSPNGKWKVACSSSGAFLWDEFDSPASGLNLGLIPIGVGSGTPGVPHVDNDGFAYGSGPNPITASPGAWVRWPNASSLTNINTYLAVRGVASIGTIAQIHWVSADRDKMLVTYIPSGFAQNLAWIEGLQTRISGKVTLSDYVPSPSTQKISVIIKSSDDATVVRSFSNVSVDGSGNWTVLCDNLSSDNYNIYVKGSHWLQKKVSGVFFDGESATGVDTTHANGDIDNDNSVTVFDYGVLSDYFDKTSADSDWLTVGVNLFRPVDADLDGDDSVTVFDYGYISDNFDQTGD